MKQIFKFLIIPLVAVFFVSACGSKSDKKDAKQETIKIGAILPLTGDLAFLGEPIRYATDIAVEEINSDGGVDGKNIRVLYEDSQASATEGVSAANRLIDMNNISIITTFLTAVSEAVKPVTESAGALLLAQTVSPSIYKNSDLTIRFHYSFTQEGKILRDYITSQEPSNVCLVHSSDPSTSFQVDSLIVPGLTDNNISYMQEKFSVGTRDFKTAAAKVKDAECGLISIAGYGNDISFLLRDLSSVDVTGQNHQIVGNIGFIEIPDNVDKSIYEGTVYTAPPFMISPEEETEAATFINKYKETSGRDEVGYAAYYAYDLIKILADVLENVESTDPAAVKEGFTGEYQGIGGNYTVEPSGDVITEITLGTMTNGKMVPLQE